MKPAQDRRRRFRPLGLFLLLTLGVGALASAISEPALANWYAGLRQPAFAPAIWLLLPVWTALYVVMAAAAWRVWRTGGNRAAPMTAFGAQLALGLIWNLLFFALHHLAFALAAQTLLDAALLMTLILFWNRDRGAGALMALVLGWNGFATLLGHQLWRLNS